jgi:hypothetical protein
MDRRVLLRQLSGRALALAAVVAQNGLALR